MQICPGRRPPPVRHYFGEDYALKELLVGRRPDVPQGREHAALSKPQGNSNTRRGRPELALGPSHLIRTRHHPLTPLRSPSHAHSGVLAAGRAVTASLTKAKFHLHSCPTGQQPHKTTEINDKGSPSSTSHRLYCQRPNRSSNRVYIDSTKLNLVLDWYNRSCNKLPH